MKPLLDRSEGTVLDYLMSRHYSTCYDDTETTVQKNLIVALQAHTLLEDCMTEEDGHKRSVFRAKTNCVWVGLQKAVWQPQADNTNHGAVFNLLRIYSRAREQEVLCFAIHGKEPPLSTTPLNALLIMMMDRYLLFECTNKTIRQTRDFVPF